MNGLEADMVAVACTIVVIAVGVLAAVWWGGRALSRYLRRRDDDHGYLWPYRTARLDELMGDSDTEAIEVVT